MSRVKKLLTIGLVVVLMFSMTACGNKLVGTWAMSIELLDGEESVLTFNSDGTCSTSLSGIVVDGTYTTDGNKLVLTLTVLGTTSEPQNYEYAIDGDTLTLTDTTYGTVTVYTKK